MKGIACLVTSAAAVSSLVGCSGEAGRSGPDAPAERRLVALGATDHLGGLAREPMIVETADGGLFVAGYGEDVPTLWRSADGGGTWGPVDVGSEADGAVGNSDVDLALGPDGTLYFVTMSFDPQVFEGTGISVGSSRDGGESWTWTSLSRDRFDDRPWIEVAPDGVAHVIWNDGSGVSHAVSTDRGLTWSEEPRVHALGGSSHLAIGPDGAMAVRITPLSASGNRYDPGTDHVAVSIDGGESWVLRDLPGTRSWNQSFDPRQGILRWVEPLAWDGAGALYSLSSEGDTLWLARSPDQGATWRRWPLVVGADMLYFPYLVARGEGELGATWFEGVGDALRANLAVASVDPSGDAPPRVTRADPFTFPAFDQGDEGAPPTRDTAGEYLPILFLRDGRLAVVSTIQDPTGDRWGFTFRPYRIEGVDPGS